MKTRKNEEEECCDCPMGPCPRAPPRAQPPPAGGPRTRIGPCAATGNVAGRTLAATPAPPRFEANICARALRRSWPPPHQSRPRTEQTFTSSKAKRCIHSLAIWSNCFRPRATNMKPRKSSGLGSFNDTRSSTAPILAARAPATERGCSTSMRLALRLRSFCFVVSGKYTQGPDKQTAALSATGRTESWAYKNGPDNCLTAHNQCEE
jgi:hypothetical protein